MISCKAHSCGTLAGWLLSSVFYQWEEWSAEKSGDFTDLVCDSTRALPGMVGKQEVHRSGIHRGGGAVLTYPAGQIFNHSHLCKKIPQRLYQRRASCKKPEDEVRENKTFSTFQTMKQPRSLLLLFHCPDTLQYRMLLMSSWGSDCFSSASLIIVPEFWDSTLHLWSSPLFHLYLFWGPSSHLKWHWESFSFLKNTFKRE